MSVTKKLKLTEANIETNLTQNADFRHAEFPDPPKKHRGKSGDRWTRLGLGGGMDGVVLVASLLLLPFAVGETAKEAVTCSEDTDCKDFSEKSVCIRDENDRCHCASAQAAGDTKIGVRKCGFDVYVRHESSPYVKLAEIWLIG
ncbi:unnamed protein product [Darwinula stevensoni]|uniref:Uncharacterized protein n=1 Tax=Darwinula stevensoni TaxID=69355 RepID=A0A7R9A9C4_9CRUS|nr:unnamed protein product [Darwinula stevensoni]CAG0897157.1 unnamed protein product [Darwinula stevensoni]